MAETRVERTIAALSAIGRPFSSVEVAEAAGVSRQAAHKALAILKRAGVVEAVGVGRNARWQKATGGELRLRFPLATSAEDRIWTEHFAAHPAVRKLGAAARAILNYTLSEMLNNAIDHSGGTELELHFRHGPGAHVFEVLDDGIGIFDRVRRGLKLRGPLEAAAELTKGKVTTDAARHTGEGIFFTSRAAARFSAESGGLALLIDNRRGDSSVLEAPDRKGTRIRVELARRPKLSLEKLFARYTDDFEFTRTDIVVKLFEHGTAFISRSEARRLLHGLERFRKITLDFRGVRGVGQGFADEVFRVWPSQNHASAIAPIRMNAAVSFMVRRALRVAR